MSSRRETIIQIRKMIKEALQDDQPLPPEQQSTSECPAGMIKTGSGSMDGTKPICRYPTEQEKAGMEMGKKAGKFIGDLTNRARQGIQQGIQGGLDFLQGYQSRGICPPGMEQTGEGPNGPLCSPKDTGGVAKQKAVCKLPEIRSIQQMYNKMVGADKQIKEDGILGKNTKMAISYLASSAKVDQGSIPKACDRKAYAQLLQKLSSTIQPAVSTQPVAQTSLGPKDQASLVLNKIKSMKLKDVAGVKAAVEAELKPMRSKGPITEKEIDAAFNAARENFPGSFSTITSLEESWVNKNKHKYSNNLFERLVKDASKNKRL